MSCPATHTDADGRQAVEPDVNCEPLERVTVDGEIMDLNPCGLIANSMFNGESRSWGE